MGNKDIADFMGWDIKNPMSLPKSIQQPIYDNCWFYKFDKSWDWLMPVVEKIESFGYEFTIVENRCKVSHNTDHSIEELFHIEIIGSKFKVTYEAVLEFIKKFNNKNH
jgi:hypothetical protein